MSVLDNLAKPRVLGVLLAIAAGIILLLIGLIAGRFTASWLQPQPVFTRFDRGMPFFSAHAQHGKFHDTFSDMRKHLPDPREQHRKMRTLHDELNKELLKATPDRAVLDKHMSAIRTEMQTTQKAMQDAFIEAALKLPVEQRQELLRNMHHRRHGFGERWHGKPDRHHAPPPEAGTFEIELPPPH